MKFRMRGTGVYYVHGRTFRGGREYETDDPYIMQQVINNHGFTVLSLDDGSAPEVVAEPEIIDEGDAFDAQESANEVRVFQPVEELDNEDDDVDEEVVGQPANEYGKYDCRLDGCDRVGDSGFTTEHGARIHEGRCSLGVKESE